MALGVGAYMWLLCLGVRRLSKSAISVFFYTERLVRTGINSRGAGVL
jgi:hypothetical protein